MLRLEVADHRYHPLRPVLDGISIRLQRGELISLIGPSGCGKSTILKAAAGLLEPTEGEVHNSFGETAILFQEPRLLPWKSLLDNIAFGLRGRGVSKSESRDLAARVAATLGLEAGDFGKYPAELSGGMARRVALARALLVNPDLLLLDEPFSSLDTARRSSLYRLLFQEIRARDLSVLMVTHQITEALCLSDRVLVMAHDPGRIIRDIRLPASDGERLRSGMLDQEQQLAADLGIDDLLELLHVEQT